MNKNLLQSVRWLATLGLWAWLASVQSVAQVYLSENFNGAAMPAGWAVTDGGSTTETWKIQQPFIYNSTDTITMGGSNFLFSNGDINGSGSTTNERIESPVINAVGASGLFLSFDQYFRRAGETFVDSGFVEVFNGTQWVRILSLSQTLGKGNAPEHSKISIAQYNNSQLKVRFIHKGNWPYYWALDNIKVYTPSAADLGVAAIEIPATCVLPSTFQLKIKIANHGTAPQTGFPVFYSVNGQNPVQETFSGSIPADDTLQYTFNTAVIASQPGNYSIKAWTGLSGDADANNDSATNAGGKRPKSLMPTVAFENYNGDNLGAAYPGWSEASGNPPAGTFSAWFTSNADQTTYFGSVTARINLYFNNKREWMILPTVSPGPGTVLRFKIALTSYGTTTSNTMGSDDSLIVRASTDCGATWQNIKSYTAADNLTNTLTSMIVPLDGLEGQDVTLAFYGTEGTEDNDPDYDIHIDDVEVTVPSPTDVGVTALNLPPADCGIPASFNLVARVYNNGNATQTGFPVSYKLDNQTPVTETFTASIAPGATVNFTFATPVAVATPGAHTLSAWTSLSGDPNPLNDSVVGVTIVRPGSTVPLVNFTGYNGDNIATLFQGWREQAGVPPTGTFSNWVNNSDSQQDSMGTVTAKVNLYSNFRREWLVSPALVPVAGTVLKYKIAVSNWGEPGADEMGSDDSVSVLASADCGATWTRLVSYTVADQLTQQLVEKTVPLTQFAGQPIIIGFFGTDGTVDDDQDYDFHVDDVQALLPANNDVGVSSLLLPNLDCGVPNTLTLTSRIMNYGAQAQSNFPVSYTLNGGTPVTETYSGTLTPGATADFTFTTPLDLTSAGIYYISSWTSLTGDAIAGNDSLKNRKIVKSAGSLAGVNFNNFTGANLPAVAEGWKEQKGAVPTGNASEWVNCNATQSTAFGSTTAMVNFIVADKKEWIVGPPVTADANTFLKFKTAVTTHNQATNYASGMGVDDSLNIMVSNNCGTSWGRVAAYTKSSGLNNQLAQQSIDLSSYAGQSILVAFFATEGVVNDPNNYDLHIDDVDVSPFTRTTDVTRIQNLLIFPNPATSYADIVCNRAAIISVFGSDGRNVFSTSVLNSEGVFRLDTQTFPTGVYMVQLRDETGRIYQTRLSVIR